MPWDGRIVVETAVGVAVAGDSVRMSAHGLHMGRGVAFETWLAVGSRLSRVSKGSAWCLGDWLLYGERAYGRKYKRALDVTRLDYQTLRNYAWVARQFEPSRRRDTLSFQHHAEVASLPEPDQELWLRRAETAHWSRNELRAQLAAERGRQLSANRESAEPADRDSASSSQPAGRHVPPSDREASESVRIRTARPRVERWRQAAKADKLGLVDWLGSVADAAAARRLAAVQQADRESCAHRDDDG
jgi:hypothetical protein